MIATLVGYHGRRNLGDDVFLRVAVSWLASLGVTRVFVSGFASEIPSSLFGVELIGYERRVRIARYVWFQTFVNALRSRMLVFASGSILTVQPFVLATVVLQLLRVLRPGLAVVALGISIGPFRSKFDRRWCGRLLRNFDRVVLRDPVSAHGWESAQFPMTISYDIALLWRPRLEIKRTSVNPVVSLCLNTRGENGPLILKDIDSCVAALAGIAKSISNLVVNVIATCSDHNDGDEGLAKILVAKMANAGLVTDVHVYDGSDPERTLQQIVSSQAVISSRMHPGVFGLAAGVPVFQIAYAPKIADFYKHCELGGEDLVAPGVADVEEIRTFLEKALTGKLRDRASSRAARLRECAEHVRLTLDEVASSMCVPYE